MLIHLVGRSAVQARDRQWSAHAALNVPFLTTREFFLLKFVHPALAHQYLRLAPGQRAAFLAYSVDPLPLSQAQLQNLASPADIDIEWFASPDDICRAFAGLQQLAAQPRLAPLGSILSANNGGIELDPAQWPTVWYKGRRRTRGAGRGVSGHQQQRPDLRRGRDAQRPGSGTAPISHD
jgi:hypothetical protein